MKHLSFSRRQFLASSAGLAVMGSLMTNRALSASALNANESRFILVQLRGGLDGLTVAPAIGDPQFESVRGALAIPRHGEGAALRLDGFFGLHPALQSMHALYQKREMLVVHAVATPYRQRSHFDAQDMLETGATTPFGLTDGWLNRALMATHQGNKEVAVALGSNVPLVLQGRALVGSRAPHYLRRVNDDTLARIARMYAPHSDLVAIVERANVALKQPHRNDDATSNAHPWIEAAESAAKLLSIANGPRIAVIDTDGWDSHATQSSPQGIPGRALKALDSTVETLRRDLGAYWKNTMVAIVTEFGRTVRANGSGGTDHGTGAAMFLLGGAVAGGRVIADWPGLAANQLHEQRDLRGTTDTFAVLASALADHWGAAPRTISEAIAPDRKLQLIGGLLRA
jgi:uncharacterized protein (DUF1501 family)